MESIPMISSFSLTAICRIPFFSMIKNAAAISLFDSMEITGVDMIDSARTSMGFFI